MITTLIETDDLADLQAWVAEFSITHPVGADGDRVVYDAYKIMEGRPQYAVIDRDFRLLNVTRYYDEAEGWLVDLL